MIGSLGPLHSPQLSSTTHPNWTKKWTTSLSLSLYIPLSKNTPIVYIATKYLTHTTQHNTVLVLLSPSSNSSLYLPDLSALSHLQIRLSRRLQSAWFFPKSELFVLQIWSESIKMASYSVPCPKTSAICAASRPSPKQNQPLQQCSVLLHSSSKALLTGSSLRFQVNFVLLGRFLDSLIYQQWISKLFDWGKLDDLIVESKVKERKWKEDLFSCTQLIRMKIFNNFGKKNLLRKAD